MSKPTPSKKPGRKRRLGLLSRAFLVLVIATVSVLAVWYEPDPGGNAPRVLVAIDRSAWNTVGLNRFTYVRALRRQGLSPVLAEYPNDLDQFADIWSDDYAGLVLTGGGDVAAKEYGGNPDISLAVSLARDEFELALLDIADERALPILGLCRGAQLLNVWNGGTLGDHRHDSARFSEHRKMMSGHAVSFTDPSRLSRVYGKPRLESVTTWHGQFVEIPGTDVRITAYADDGTPEGIEMDGDVFRIGVQWHAEMPPWDDSNEPLFEAYAEAVRQASTNAEKSAR